MKNNIIPALRLTLVSFAFFCGIYTLAVYGVSRLVPESMSFTKAKQGYYENVGQPFTSNHYFNSRPSAVNYNAAGSGGSNKGPGNPDYLAEVQTRIDTFLVHNPDIRKEDIPSDLVTASGSGLDPNISVEGAVVQVKRIAQIRDINERTIYQLIEKQTEQPLLGILGTQKINVLELNLALDKIK